MPDYTFYTTDYLGEDIPEDQFPRYARRAGLKLERMRQLYATAPRPGVPDAEDNAVCAIAAAPTTNNPTLIVTFPCFIIDIILIYTQI